MDPGTWRIKDMKQPMITSEVARALRVSGDTVRRWANSGKLKAVRTETGVRLFDRREVDALKQSRRQREPMSVAGGEA